MKENKSCIICNNKDFEEYLRARDHMISGEEFLLVKCRECGLIRTHIPPGENESAPYYNSDKYISHSDTRRGAINALYHMARNWMLKRKWKLISHLSEDKSVLDIGCGTGYFLNFMKHKGYRIAGIEREEKTRNFAAEKFGLGIKRPEEFLNNSIEGSFGVITLWHVLEHLYDPAGYIRAAAKKLSPGGALVIALPNCSSYDAGYYKNWWAGYDVPRHLWHFSPHTLTAFARQNGFKVAKLLRLPLDPFYNAMLSEKYRNGYLLAGLCVGGLAFAASVSDIRKSSSLIYILRKTGDV